MRLRPVIFVGSGVRVPTFDIERGSIKCCDRVRTTHTSIQVSLVHSHLHTAYTGSIGKTRNLGSAIGTQSDEVIFMRPVVH